MKNNKNNSTIILASVCMIVMILDATTVLAGADEGIRLCVSTVIPSLFPFFVVSNMISGSVVGRDIPPLRSLGRFCGMPAGSEYAFVLGVLGGYPIGAQTARQLYASNSIRKQDASRILAFCNNPGPAFIFGMTATLFPSPIYAWALWMIVILSALITARIIPSKQSAAQKEFLTKSVTITDAMTNGLKAIANVCGWVIVFRILITILECRVIHNAPAVIRTLCPGVLELSNGVVELHRIQNQALRFVLCSIYLSFGGLCVCMQTHSVAKGLSMHCYYTGKLLQTTVSTLLSVSTLPMLFSIKYNILFVICGICSAILIIRTLFFKKRVAILKKMIYNIGN